MRLLLTILFFAAIYLAQGQNWSQLSNFPGASRDDGCSFTINNVAYCGTGRDAGFALTEDFYSFDFSTEQWTQIGGMPFSARRQYATAGTYDSQGYVFGGINEQGDYLRDMWRYNPTMNSWYYMGQAPFEGRSGMQSFVIDDMFFVVGGRTANLSATNELWGFDFLTNTWSSFTALPCEGIWRGFGTQYEGMGIVGMGSDSTNTKRGEVYFYDSALDSWMEVVQAQTEPMTYPTFGIINDRLFVYGGEDTLDVYRNDFRYLDLTNLTWNTMNAFPQEARRGTMAFTSASDFYFTTGLSTTQRLDATWVARSVASTNEQEPLEEMVIYAVDDVMLLSENFEQCSLFSSSGQLIPLRPLEPGAFRLPIGLASGIYFCQGSTGGRIYQGKLVIQ